MISFGKGLEPIKVEKTSNLMQTLLKAGRPVASSCYGKGVCSKCRVTVLKGMENLSPESELEKDLKAKNDLGPEIRISCQTAVGPEDVKLDAPYW